MDIKLTVEFDLKDSTKQEADFLVEELMLIASKMLTEGTLEARVMGVNYSIEAVDVCQQK